MDSYEYDTTMECRDNGVLCGVVRGRGYYLLHFYFILILYLFRFYPFEKATHLSVSRSLSRFVFTENGQTALAFIFHFNVRSQREPISHLYILNDLTLI